MRHRRLLAAGAALDLLAVLACLVLPLYSGDGSGGPGSATLLAVNGPGALLPLGLLLGLGLLAWAAPWRMLRLLAVLLHGVLTVLALLSIGVFFLPAAAVLALGGFRELTAPTAPRVTAPA
ncbi:hypothetical protein [Phycicoccus sonneratiae]|uniref:Uncharacterized protein n=1 Tax=Phycicoccus sonneratiae TaxID=2807628 RepID=A0ABS2CJS5_9MICO|nr:hypothetical protein [Phycicoccus sonneraticus]MBM6400127.1 hypothetical protein [Phycicoccus sonneraticus]